MSAQPYGLDPEKKEFWAGEQSWGEFRMYWSEKQARRNASPPCKYIDGKRTAIRPARIYKVTMNWEEI